MLRRSSLIICSLLLLVACTGQKKPQPVKVPVDPMHGKETAFLYGQILGVGGVNANGVGYIHEFEDNTAIVIATLNIQPARTGMIYIGWAAKAGGSSPQRISTMDNPLGDVRHVMKAEVAKDLSNDTMMFVTLEKSKSPGTPGKHVAEGELKRVH